LGARKSGGASIMTDIQPFYAMTLRMAIMRASF